MRKTRAQLDAEIAAAIRGPLSRGPISSSESLSGFAERVGRERGNRQKRLHQALLRHPALIVTDRRGGQTLLILSGEMSNPEEGAHRVTKLLRDGPLGHVTRRSVADLARELARDLTPDRIDPASDEEVSAWVSTPEYAEGSERVLEMQRRNQR